MTRFEAHGLLFWLQSHGTEDRELFDCDPPEGWSAYVTALVALAGRLDGCHSLADVLTAAAESKPLLESGEITRDELDRETGRVVAEVMECGPLLERALERAESYRWN